ncbi:ISSoc13, transposase orfB [Candidatus Jidaibacter acanthamoeba]|uniref:ISSoc13, transposase orfB n=1 Tax=Candidatus Jidaibacter acanthamoebae TaxID=86105 RepID=A0A0C1QZW5_9RICK|nr:ISSoc13, transposase orfB [Candidatus Jidaibacter acanthamoeba]
MKPNQSVIPLKSNRKNSTSYDSHLYKERHLIKCFFGKIKHSRRTFSRFDKIANAFLNLVETLLWLG